MATRRVDIRINVDDIDAGKRLDAIAAKLDKLSKGTFTIKLRLDDGGTAAKLDKMAAKLDKIGTKTYTPKIGLGGITKADAELDKLDARLDKIGHKRVTATVHIRTTGGAKSDIQRLLSGGGGGGSSNLEKDAAAAAGGGSTGALSALGGANNSFFGALIAALVGYGMSVGPALIPFGLGGLAGGGGALLASRLGTTGLTALRGDRQALAQARAALAGTRGNTPSNRLSLRQAQSQLTRDQSKYGGFVPFGQATNALGKSALGSFLTAVTGTSPGFSAGPHGQPGGSFLQGLTPIFTQIGAFLKSIGPGLGDLFRASLPSLAAFVKIGEQFAKAVLPAMTQSIKALGPSLPTLVQGFKYLSEGIAGFIINLGPGIKDAAIIFKGSMLVMKGVLQLVGVAASVFAIGIVKTAEFVRAFAHNVPVMFDEMRHNVAVEFDTLRHNISSAWDAVYQNTVARVGHMVQSVMNFDANLRHGIAHDFDTIRQDIAQAWTTIWTNTVNAVSRGFHTVIGWFDKFPGTIKSALGSLGGALLSIGKTAMNDFLSGIKSVGGSILSWIKGFFAGIPHAIMSLLHMSPPHPGSAFFDLGANFMHHLEAGIKSRASRVAGALHGATGGPSGASVGAAARYAQSLLGRYGWGGQWGALNSVAMRESGWSMTARNPSSGAYGIAQFINGPSEYYQYGGNPGTIAGQVTAFMNYVKQRYGSPNAAWAHELNYGWYDKGGVLPKGLTLALNTTGHEEQIVNSRPWGGGGGGTVINIMVNGDTDPDGAALKIVQKLRKYKTRHGGAALGIG